MLLLSLVLITLFRTFVGEPFTVPTGSMAPTLLGRHKDFVCHECGCPGCVSSSDEIDLATGQDRLWIRGSECPNDHTLCDVSNINSTNGDRIWVVKNPFGGYHRFDVAVFKNIDEPRLNYVKRLIGMPGETVRLHRGEIEIQSPDTDKWSLVRKPAELIDAMAILVQDDRYPADKRGKPLRWQPEPRSAWLIQGASYRVSDQASGIAKLVYRHLLDGNPQPQLITDYLNYNSTLNETEVSQAWAFRIKVGNPVKDLLVAFTAEATAATTLLGAEFATGDDRFVWQWEKDTGKHVFRRNGEVLAERAGRADQLSGRWQFANVDRTLLLWKEGKLLLEIPYEPVVGAKKGPSAADLQPVKLVASGVGTKLSDIVLKRDVYYRRLSHQLDFLSPGRDTAFFSDPKQWSRIEKIAPMAHPWKLGPGEYIALGDNSASSNDSRHWRYGAKVSEQMLLGRAVWVLWPPWRGRIK